MKTLLKKAAALIAIIILYPLMVIATAVTAAYALGLHSPASLYSAILLIVRDPQKKVATLIIFEILFLFMGTVTAGIIVYTLNLNSPAAFPVDI